MANCSLPMPSKNIRFPFLSLRQSGGHHPLFLRSPTLLQLVHDTVLPLVHSGDNRLLLKIIYIRQIIIGLICIEES